MSSRQNEGAVLQSVYVVGYQSFTLYFGFEMNGEEQIGTVTNYDSILINGLEYGRGKLGNDVESFAKFCEGLDKNLPMKAEIVKKMKKCKTQIIQVRRLSRICIGIAKPDRLSSDSFAFKKLYIMLNFADCLVENS